MWVEKQEEKQQDIDKTLESIIGEDWKADGDKKGKKQALAGIMEYLPSNKKLGKDAPNIQELQNAMNRKIDSDTISSDIANNPKVKEIKEEMKKRIWSQDDPAKLLKEYSEMRGMLDGAIWANEKAQNMQSENALQSSQKNQQSNELANLDFIELGKKFREATAQVQIEKQKDNANLADIARNKGNQYTGKENPPYWSEVMAKANDRLALA